MRANEKQETWEKWRDEELLRARTYLARLHYTLDDEQAHISGERFLVSGHKLVLTGVETSSNTPVVIKWSTDKESMDEIRDERTRREILRNIHFANRAMRFPDEQYWEGNGAVTILATKFIPQKNIFIRLTISEQFFFALSALESQEGTHVATHEHERILLALGRMMHAEDYLLQFDVWCEHIRARTATENALHQSLALAGEFLRTHRTTIDRYCGVLTHTDFVPHNFRIIDRQIVILDHTSLIIGNKYESWARLINFMSLYNPELEKMLLLYVKENRGEDEYLCLRAMRIYKLGFLLDHHTAAHNVSEGDLHLLTGERVTFWGHVLDSVINNTPVTPEVVAHYRSRAIALRTKEEERRHQDISGWKQVETK